jgi:hypothetical protein
MDWNHYRFRCSWGLEAEPEAVYAVLERLEAYPEWWPQIREVRRTGETTGVLRMRSLLPYDLTVTVHSARQDADAGVLQVAMAGDLEGWARWTVRPAGSRGGTRAGGRAALVEYAQEVDVTKPLMRALAVPCRPLFRANHALMMRSCRAGLRVRLGGARLPV